NGNYFEIPNDITYGLTSISGENFYYIYIDDSDAVYPILNSDVGIVHSTDEPKWDDAKQGWYRFYEDDGITEVDSTDKDDRCIGVVWIDDSNNLRWFNNVNEQITWAERSYLASNMSGNSYVWQQPNAAEGPTVLPKNAIKAFCYIHAACGALSRATVALTSKEAADQNNYFYASNGIAARGYPKTLTMGWVYLGESRKLRIQADNSNTEVHATLQGFEISR
ncbi:MAG: hypothetical protein MI799_23015, partial [Desulfobacterales bacterium]|nr:hypothetical protein [Desulfobacterales bacterium]